MVSAVALLSPAEAAELKERFKALLEPYTARAQAGTAEPGQRHIRYFMAATPLADLDRKDHDDDSDS
jgi:hypothetical protein